MACSLSDWLRSGFLEVAGIKRNPGGDLLSWLDCFASLACARARNKLRCYDLRRTKANGPRELPNLIQPIAC